MGDWILFQDINEKGMVSRPILALYVDMTIWDQAIVVQVIEPWRAWQFSHEIITNQEKGYSSLFGLNDIEVQSFENWNCNLKILGHWKQRKPNITELKHALQLI